MTWFFLILAGLTEVVGVIGITKVNQSPSVKSYSIMVGGFLFSFIFLALAMKSISMGTAYAVWTGIGAVGSALVGMFIYGEPKNKSRIMFILLIIVSVVALKIVS